MYKWLLILGVNQFVRERIVKTGEIGRNLDMDGSNDGGALGGNVKATKLEIEPKLEVDVANGITGTLERHIFPQQLFHVGDVLRRVYIGCKCLNGGIVHAGDLLEVARDLRLLLNTCDRPQH